MYYKENLKKMSKADLCCLSVELCTEFLQLNNLTVPKYVIFRQESSPGGYCGLYTNNLIRVWASNVAKIAFVPFMRSWSYPGYKVDRTGMGVVAHETGHHVVKETGLLRKLSAELSHTLRYEKLTGYEPNLDEMLAETLRIFILNPDLLRKIAPNRYKFLVDAGLKPLIKDDWETVMKNADAKYISAVKKSIKIL